MRKKKFTSRLMALKWIRGAPIKNHEGNLNEMPKNQLNIN